MPKYDPVLIVGDFNIHVCCLEIPLAREFLNIIDSFNFVQFVLDHRRYGHRSCGPIKKQAAMVK